MVISTPVVVLAEVPAVTVVIARVVARVEVQDDVT